jgi:hypothetical protein
MAAVIPEGIPISSHSSRSSFLLTEDSSSHYYLHHGDHPGLLLVPQPLTGENYNSWSRSMTMALSAKNKLMFIDGSLAKPSHLNGPEFRAWTRCNDTISSWIVNTVSKEINTSIIYINNCRDMWLSLKERFSPRNGPKTFQLQKSISSLTQDNLSVSSYFTKLKSLCDEFDSYKAFTSCTCIPSCSCGSMKSVNTFFDQQYVYQFLMGLNESFSHIRG